MRLIWRTLPILAICLVAACDKDVETGKPNQAAAGSNSAGKAKADPYPPYILEVHKLDEAASADCMLAIRAWSAEQTSETLSSRVADTLNELESVVSRFTSGPPAPGRLSEAEVLLKAGVETKLKSLKLYEQAISTKTDPAERAKTIAEASNLFNRGQGEIAAGILHVKADIAHQQFVDEKGVVGTEL